MGKGGNSQAKTGHHIPFSEVRSHNTKNDNWLIINDDVYDVSRWQLKHPGGSRLLTHYAGQDATEAFKAFHWDRDFVAKFMAPLKIGRLAEREERREKKDVELNEEEMKADFEQLRQAAEAKNLFHPSQWFFILIVGHIILLEVAAYLVFHMFGTGWMAWIVSAICYATSQAQAGWAQHDFGHLSVFKSRKMNHFMHLFLMNHIKGASAGWWNHMHYQHHSKPNCLNKDPDVRIDALFVVGEEMPKRIAKERVRSMPYNYQHKYFSFIGPPLLFPLFFQVMVFRHPITRRNWTDLAVMLTFYAKLLTLYIPVLGWTGLLAYYFVFRCLESAWFVWVSQSNHIVMDIDDDKERPWLSLQLNATCNVEKSFFNDWFTGHLNHQIEHHLFPMMPRHNLYKITPLVKELCKKHNIPYVTKSLVTAFTDILRSLKHSGQIWEAYYHAFHCE